MRRVFGVCFSLLLCGACLSVASAQEKTGSDRAGNVGISKTKPTTGPVIEVEGGYMVPYTVSIPGTSVNFTMLPIPGGVAEMGSPADSPGHKDDEGPVVKVQIEPLWMAKCEISWAEYKTFMSMYKVFKTFEQKKMRKVDASKLAATLTVPTQLYEPTFTYEFGEEPDMPAITITQYSAKQYTKWLSGLTSLQYRLPTEAEWEYACRAGTKTAYSFGDDEGMLGDYAWFADNSEEKLHPVGAKKPNPWGLHDMHGGVMEWVIDGHSEDGYQALSKMKQPIPLIDAVNWPKELMHRALRGGGWQDSPAALRSAARVSSDDEAWKETDPNLPKSPWWYTDDPARAVGFRIVRSAKPLDEKTIVKFHDIDNADIQLSVDIRLEEGRGVRGYSDPSLADEIKKSSGE